MLRSPIGIVWEAEGRDGQLTVSIGELAPGYVAATLPELQPGLVLTRVGGTGIQDLDFDPIIDLICAPRSAEDPLVSETTPPQPNVA